MKRLIPNFILKFLVWRNLRLRIEGKKPDEWYWAELELIRRGYYNEDIMRLLNIHIITDKKLKNIIKEAKKELVKKIYCTPAKKTVNRKDLGIDDA